MSDLINETFTPEGEKGKKSPRKFEIKPLTEMQLAGLIMDHGRTANGMITLSSEGAEKCLKYGLVNPDDLDTMKAVHIIAVSRRIFEKALISQEEEKN